MLLNPELATRLTREHQRQLRADARRQPDQRDRMAPPAPGTPGCATRIRRGLAAAIVWGGTPRVSARS